MPASSPGLLIPTFTGGNLNGTHTIAAEFLATDAVTVSPFATWSTTNAPTTGNDPSDDEDGDGVSNGVEFVLGGDKDSNDLDKLPAAATDATNMTFTFVRDQASIDASVSVEIEVGANLASWPTSYTVGADTAGSDAGITVAKDTPVAGKDTVTLTVAQAPDIRKFARLKVVISP